MNKNRGKKRRETGVYLSRRTQSLNSKSGHFGGVGSIPSTPTKNMDTINSKYLSKIKDNFLDLINEELTNNDPHLKKSLNLWGENLHKKNV